MPIAYRIRCGCFAWSKASRSRSLRNWDLGRTHISPERGKTLTRGYEVSRTTWLVITIAGLVAFIIGGGAALVDDGSRTSSASNAPVVTVSPSRPPTEPHSPSVDPSVSLAADEHEGDDPGHGHGKAKGHDKKGHRGHKEHGKAKGHQGDKGEEG